MTKALVNKMSNVRSNIFAVCEDAAGDRAQPAVIVYRNGWAGNVPQARAAEALLASDPTDAAPHHVVTSWDFGNGVGAVNDEDMEIAAENLYEAWVELA